MVLNKRLAWGLCWSFVVGFVATSAALAQFPQPRLQNVFPAGARRGETIELQVQGTDIEGVNALWFDHPGLRGFHIKGTTFRVAVAPGTPVGHHDLRLVGPLGISNPRVFVVGDQPETREVEPNNTAEQANPCGLNQTANGRMDNQPDVDCFAFEGKRGQRVFIELDAFRVESRLDGKLLLWGPSGRVIDESLETADDLEDPALDVSLPSDGRYVVQVRDVIYAGSPDHAYRLRIHDGPHLDAILPVCAAGGSRGEFTLIGRNLGGEPLAESTVDGRPLEKKVVTIEVPPEVDGDPLAPGQGYLSSGTSATRRGSHYAFIGPGGLASNSRFIAYSRDPAVSESEPNEGGDQAQRLSPPCVVSGQFARSDDVDAYRIEARKGQVFWIEALAEQLGSPADPSLVVQRILPEGPPQDVASADDQADPAPGFAASVANVDATLRFVVPEDGGYLVLVSDRFGSRRGDARFTYLLNIRKEQPDFRLFVMPRGTGPVASGLTLRAGGRTQATALLLRLDGFAGPVQIEASALPAGVTMNPVFVGPGQFQAPLVFTTAVDAPGGVGSIRLTGRAVSADRKEVLSYAPGTILAFPEREHPAVPLTTVRPPENTPAGLVRVTHGFPSMVVPGAAFELTVGPTEVVVAPGGSFDIQVAVARRAGFVEAVDLTTADPPPNLPAVTAKIAKEATTAALKVTVPANVPPGTYTLLVQGTGAFPFNKDPNAPQKPNLNVTSPANPITLRIQR